MKKLLFVMGFAVCLGGSAWAGVATSDRAVSETGLSYNKTYTFGLDDTANLSMQVNYTSATFPASTFTDGTQSTGNISIISNTAISSATASAKITVLSSSGTVGERICVAGYCYTEGKQFSADVVTASNTACNLSTAINAFSVILATCNIGGTTGIVYATAPASGFAGNSYTVTSTTLTWSVPATFSGGQDNAAVTIGTITYTANGNWPLGTTAALSAKQLAATINSLSTVYTATAPAASSTIVYTTSTAVGTATAYALVSSSNAALSLSPPVTLSGSQGTSALVGGTDSAYGIGSASFTIAGSTFTLALPVLYTIGTVAINPLVNNTTYYVIPVDSTHLDLATTSTGAVAGLPITITSSSTQTTAHTYTLTPSVITGTPSFKWEVSNDKTNWTALTSTIYNVTVSSITLSSYTLGGTTSIWDIGQIAYHYIRLNVIAPTLGAIQLYGFVHGKAQ